MIEQDERSADLWMITIFKRWSANEWQLKWPAIRYHDRCILVFTSDHLNVSSRYYLRESKRRIYKNLVGYCRVTQWGITESAYLNLHIWCVMGLVLSNEKGPIWRGLLTWSGLLAEILKGCSEKQRKLWCIFDSSKIGSRWSHLERHHRVF